jgi:hypothetical protein
MKTNRPSEPRNLLLSVTPWGSEALSRLSAQSVNV